MKLPQAENAPQGWEWVSIGRMNVVSKEHEKCVLRVLMSGEFFKGRIRDACSALLRLHNCSDLQHRIYVFRGMYGTINEHQEPTC